MNARTGIRPFSNYTLVSHDTRPQPHCISCSHTFLPQNHHLQCSPHTHPHHRRTIHRRCLNPSTRGKRRLAKFPAADPLHALSMVMACGLTTCHLAAPLPRPHSIHILPPRRPLSIPLLRLVRGRRYRRLRLSPVGLLGRHELCHRWIS
jgi:hypothetical protein